jgi:hypothetical protein
MSSLPKVVAWFGTVPAVPTPLSRTIPSFSTEINLFSLDIRALIAQRDPPLNGRHRRGIPSLVDL